MTTETRIPEPPPWAPPKMYAYTNPVTGETTLVDGHGVPVSSPPPFTRTVNGGVVVEDAWGNQIETYEPPTQNVFVRIGDDGIPRAVDENGYELPSPPSIVRDEKGEHQILANDGTATPIPPYEPPTSGVYVYVDADGNPVVVTGDGEPIPSPPPVYFDGDDPTPRIAGTGLTLPMYEQPSLGMFVHVSADGTPSVVYRDGHPVTSPPVVWRDGADPTWRIKGSTETLPQYTPPTADIYIHQSSDGTYQVVDDTGNLVPSPPTVYRDPIDGSFALAGPGGEQTPLPAYDPPTTGIYIHVSPDGSYQVVDRFGHLVPSPPNVYRDAETGSYVVAGPDGPGPEIPTLWPPAGEPPASWPPAGSTDGEPSPTEPGEDTTGAGDAAEEPSAGVRGAVDAGSDDESTSDVPEAEPGEPLVHPDLVEVEEEEEEEEESRTETTTLGLEADELAAASASEEADEPATAAASEEASATPVTLPLPPDPPTDGEPEVMATADGIPVPGEAVEIESAERAVVDDLPLPPDETAAVTEPALVAAIDEPAVPAPETPGERITAPLEPEPIDEETWDEPAVVEYVELVEPIIEEVEDEQLDG